MAAGEAGDVVRSRKGGVSPAEPLASAREDEESGDPVAPKLHEAGPGQLHGVLPAPAVSASAGARGVLAPRDVRAALDGKQHLPVGARTLPPGPEVAATEVAPAPCRRAEGVHVDLPQIGVTREEPDQLRRQREFSRAGPRGVPGQPLLRLGRHLEPVLDVVLLARRIGHRLAIGTQRPAEETDLHRAGGNALAGRAGTVRVIAGARQLLAAFRDVRQLLSGEPEVALAGHRPPGIGILPEALRSVVEEPEHARVVLESEHPVEGPPGGVRHADPLRRRLRAADLTIEAALLAGGGVVDQ